MRREYPRSPRPESKILAAHEGSIVTDTMLRRQFERTVWLYANKMGRHDPSTDHRRHHRSIDASM